jgi:hypothetical protein
MTLPSFTREIERMAENEALQTKTARAIVRKAGLRPVVGEVTPVGGRVHGAVDAYVDPNSGVLAWQWVVDLTNYTQLRFMANSLDAVNLWFSQSGAGSTALDPGDYEPYFGEHLDGEREQEEASVNQTLQAFMKWRLIPAAQRAPIRFSVADSRTIFRLDPTNMFASDYDGFHVWIQVK